MGMSMHRCMLMTLLFVSGLVAMCAVGHAQNSEQGGRIFKTRCSQCHVIDQSGLNKTGPNLYGIVACKSGTLPGFVYTSAMKNKGVSWTSQNLDPFIENPKKFVPGTKMVFAGMRKSADRQNLIAFIVQFRNAAAPLNACGR
jgi:cytochrome c